MHAAFLRSARRDADRTDPASEAVRLFLAHRLKAPLARQFGALTGGVPGVKWHSTAQLHVTICFVGMTSWIDSEKVGRAVKQLESDALDVEVTRLGLAPLPGGTTLVRAELAPTDRILSLHQQVRTALTAVGVAVRHGDYSPHITLGQLSGDPAGLKGWLAAHGESYRPRFVIEDYGLFATETGDDGGRHRLLTRCRLRSARW